MKKTTSRTAAANMQIRTTSRISKRSGATETAASQMEETKESMLDHPSSNLQSSILAVGSSLYRSILARPDEFAALYQPVAATAAGVLGLSGECGARFALHANGIYTLPDCPKPLNSKKSTMEQLSEAVKTAKISQVEETSKSQTLASEPTTTTKSKRSTTPTRANSKRSTSRSGTDIPEPSQHATTTYMHSDILRQTPISTLEKVQSMTGDQSAGFQGSFVENELVCIVRYCVIRPPKLLDYRGDLSGPRKVWNAFLMPHHIKAHINSSQNEESPEASNEQDEEGKLNDGPEMTSRTHKTNNTYQTQKQATLNQVKERGSAKMSDATIAAVLHDKQHPLTRALIRQVQIEGYDGWAFTYANKETNSSNSTHMKLGNTTEELFLFTPRAHLSAIAIQPIQPQLQKDALKVYLLHTNYSVTCMIFERSNTLQQLFTAIRSRYPGLSKCPEFALEINGESYRLDETDDSIDLQATLHTLGLTNNSAIRITFDQVSDSKGRKGAKSPKRK